MSAGLSARSWRSEFAADPSRVAQPAPEQAALQQERPIGARHQPGQLQIAIRQQPRMAADRRAAGTVEPRQQRPFGGG